MFSGVLEKVPGFLQGLLRSSKNLEIIKKVSEATGKVLRVSEDVAVIQGSS